jgi:LPXTG-motif cell wall-anchored protein
MRYLIGVALAAVVAAAVLRHVVHVYAGVSREEIRTVALIAAGVGLLLAMLIFRRRKKRP